MDGRKPLPDEFSSIEDIQDFWDRQSSADYAADMEPVEIELSDALKTKIESKKLYQLLRLSSRQIALIENLAKKEHVGIRELIARWTLEHLNEPSAA